MAVDGPNDEMVILSMSLVPSLNVVASRTMPSDSSDARLFIILEYVDDWYNVGTTS